MEPLLLLYLSPSWKEKKKALNFHRTFYRYIATTIVVTKLFLIKKIISPKLLRWQHYVVAIYWSYSDDICVVTIDIVSVEQFSCCDSWFYPYGFYHTSILKYTSLVSTSYAHVELTSLLVEQLSYSTFLLTSQSSFYGIRLLTSFSISSNYIKIWISITSHHWSKILLFHKIGEIDN